VMARSVKEDEYRIEARHGIGALPPALQHYITSTKLLWCLWSLGAIKRWTSPFNLTFSSSS
jgi:hypothetical protein